MTFDLNRLPFGTTLARQIARQHLTRFNNVYWVAERSSRYLRSAHPHLHFPPPAPGVHGIFTAPQWEKAAEEHHAWVRQHVLVSAASLLEVYIRSASVSAVTARPELIDKTYIGIDGFSFVKSKTMPKSLRDLIEAVTGGFIFGPWTDRFRRLARVFGAIPQPLLDLTLTLQSIQTKRNKIAHEFGNDGKGRQAPWDAFAIIQVGPKEIQEAITAVSNAIALFDMRLFGPSIGGHEILQQYHIWKGKQKNYHKLYVSGGLANEFRTYLGEQYGSTPGSDYIRGMIAYYNGI
ncbi:hypothetical protein V1291_004464 [Nitrobacteraceae bacterium AZCC 1564]